MKRYTYPHTIENGAGERITFHRRVPGATGDRLEADNVVQPGAGPPMHVHHFEEEVFTVRQGRMGYQRPGEPPRFAELGETVTFRAGEPHRFWNAGDEELVCTGHIEPAGNVEYLLTQLFDSTKQNGGTRPDPFDAAFLMRRYRTEFTMLEIPWVVQGLLFPLMVTVGKALGKYRKYADAPEPVRRRND